MNFQSIFARAKARLPLKIGYQLDAAVLIKLAVIQYNISVIVRVTHSNFAVGEHLNIVIAVYESDYEKTIEAIYNEFVKN